MADYEQFYNEDFIAHYTKLENAQKILDENRIRMSNRSNSLDCIERIFAENTMRISSCNPMNEEYLKSDEIQHFVQYNVNRHKELHQACFCKTGKKESYRSHKLDELSFLHLRMWEQYGDRYNGICFVLSRQILEKDNPECIFKDVEYKSLEVLNMINTGESLNGDRLREVDEDSFKIEQDAHIIHRATLKTKDYENENELRSMKFCAEEYCYLDISNSIVAIALFQNHHYELEMNRLKSSDQQQNAISNELEAFKRKQIKFLRSCQSRRIPIFKIGTSNGRLYVISESEANKRNQRIKTSCSYE